ncbi:MAG: FdtA/QdtA family cupin domain-containing protein [Rhodobacteraceae bacterium]|jgi:hypothetical protein|nr:FdtA/QdtA family cupin domain-containing protein [Paracoccaceae bacterium]
MATNCRLVDLRSFVDDRGRLGVIEGSDLPFAIKRMYFLYGVPVDGIRGEHGHRLLEQMIVCMNGACDVTLHDGTSEQVYHLESPAVGLYVAPAMWRSLKFLKEDSVICVLASRPFEVSDYIYHFDEFVAWSQGNMAQSVSS